MGFFESLREPPAPPAPRPPRPAWIQPEYVLPGSVAQDLVLIRTDQVAIMIGSMRAYPTGFEFTVDTRVRHPLELGRPGAEVSLHPGSPDMGEGALQMGLLYADGRLGTTTATHYAIRGEGLEPGRLVMMQGGGGGNGRTWHTSYWVYPLPPPGPVAFYAAWPAHGVAETRVEIDGGLIRDAADRAIALWPEEDDDPLPGATTGVAMIFTRDDPDTPEQDHTSG